MDAGVSQQTLNRAARKRLQKLQADFNKNAVDGRAVYLRAARQHYPEVVFPDGTVASVNVFRASNGGAFMRLTVCPVGGYRFAVKESGSEEDLDFVKKFLT